MAQQVAWLVALEEIRQVVGRYAQAGDDHNNPATLATLFTDDAVWEAPGFGRYSGRTAICEALAAIGRERITWSLHFPVHPMIELTGDDGHAEATWWLWELMTLREDDGASTSVMLGARYAATFIRAADSWKISHLLLTIERMIPFDDPGPPELSQR